MNPISIPGGGFFFQETVIQAFRKECPFPPALRGEIIAWGGENIALRSMVGVEEDPETETEIASQEARAKELLQSSGNLRAIRYFPPGQLRCPYSKSLLEQVFDRAIENQKKCERILEAADEVLSPSSFSFLGISKLVGQAFIQAVYRIGCVSAFLKVSRFADRYADRLQSRVFSLIYEVAFSCIGTLPANFLRYYKEEASSLYLRVKELAGVSSLVVFALSSIIAEDLLSRGSPTMRRYAGQIANICLIAAAFFFPWLTSFYSIMVSYAWSCGIATEIGRSVEELATLHFTRWFPEYSQEAKVEKARALWLQIMMPDNRRPP